MVLLRTVACAVVLACATAASEPHEQVNVSQLPAECKGAGDKACIRKCCPTGQSILEKDCEPAAFKLELHYLNETMPAQPDSYVLVHGNPCKHRSYRLEPHNDAADAYYMLRSGFLVVAGLLPEPLGPNEFCMEAFSEENGSRTLPLVCFSEPNKASSPPNTLHFILYPIGLLISIPFFIAVVLVYSLIPQLLQDLNGRSLVRYCSCIAIAYFFLAVVQLGKDNINKKICVPLAFIVQFSFTACFFWLNVMCFDAFWHVLAATGVVKTYPGHKPWVWSEEFKSWIRVVTENLTVEEDQRIRENEELFRQRVFLCYSVYAWCLPVVCTLLTLVMEFNPIIPSAYMSHGFVYCWDNSAETAMFTAAEEALPFYGPISCIIVVNWLFFIVTLYKIFTFTWNNNIQRFPRQKARMILQLFVIMSISWIMEIVSWAIGGFSISLTVADGINTLLGIIVFIIFILEPRVKKLVKENLWPHILTVRDKYCCLSCSNSALPLHSQNNTKLTYISDDELE